MSVPILPASAPFSAEQRAWLNGFFAGLLGLDGNASNGVVNNGVGADGVAAQSEYNAAGESEMAHDVEEFPWHDAICHWTSACKWRRASRSRGS
jgi:sulfite reductase (NADPH) flavoprotein alpha-component